MEIKNMRVGVLFAVLAVMTILAACTSTRPEVYYPVYVQVAEMPDSFLAGFPNTRAKVFAEDNRTRRISMRLQLPSEWSFVTGAAPNKTIEIYVLEGDLTLGEFELGPGGYAYLPSGTMGVSMSSVSGAMLLYYIDEVQAGAVIQTPIISNSNLLEWRAASDAIEEFGISTKELRMDPGSGARTWLLKIEPGAVQDWQKASNTQEGFMLSGEYHHVECSDLGPVWGDYLAGGYFLRPANAVNGGPESAAAQTSIWLMRVPNSTSITRDLYCGL
jgi:glyoxylate utilization-related uncharacterized protein